MKITTMTPMPAVTPPPVHTLTVSQAELMVLRNAVGTYEYAVAKERGDDMNALSETYAALCKATRK